jgi:hypothetical protein
MSRYRLRSERISLKQFVAFSPTRPATPWRVHRFLVAPAHRVAPDGTPLCGLSDRAVGLGARQGDRCYIPPWGTSSATPAMGSARGSAPW